MRPSSTSPLRRRRTLRRWSMRHAAGLAALYRRHQALLLRLGPLARLLRSLGLARPVTALERAVKGLLFDCRMCGLCVLSATGMVCPMTCPKQLRNGPCGGVRADGHCEVEPALPCVWMDAWAGAARMGPHARIGAIQAPLDQSLAGRSTWLALMDGRHPPVPPPAAVTREPAPEPERTPPRTGGALAARLNSGAFCVTAEFNPPDTAQPVAILERARQLTDICDAVNVTDGAGAHTHIASAAVCALLVREGVEAVMQIACRDRNRIAIQADALGAAALGVHNLLCLTGDGIAGGDQPDAKPVFDLDSTSLLGTLRTLRDEGRFRSGRPLAAAPPFFLGATSNPFVLPPALEVARLRKKIAAGAQFIQSQFCFDVPALAEFMRWYREEGWHHQCHYLVGVGPLRSAASARWMRAHIAGVRIPDALIARLERAADPRAEGIRICVETIHALRQVAGVAGVHIMAFQQAETVREIVEAAGLAPRPARAAPGRPG